jgi:hypothetical protein
LDIVLAKVDAACERDCGTTLEIALEKACAALQLSSTWASAVVRATLSATYMNN